jgi:hypothetical protein
MLSIVYVGCSGWNIAAMLAMLAMLPRILAILFALEWSEYVLFGVLEWIKIGDLTTQYSH